MDSREAADSVELPFLTLLVQDAAAAEYDRPLDRARAQGASPERLAALDRARSQALRVRASVREQRRREAELAALFETAGDLAGRHDLDDVLQAIVVRARKLLTTDVAYLSLNDPAAGDTYMRVTAGSVSARFQRVRLGFGEGLGGLVAQTSLPYVTPDYFHDSRFQHTHLIDAAVHEEGLVAILGVPLMVNAKVIGVLFAADRRVRPFSRDEVALLGSLATHAAIAIESANQLAETKAALASLSAANRQVQEHSAAVERAVETHEALTGALLRGAGVDELAASMAESLGGAVSIVDEFGRAVGAGGQPVRGQTGRGQAARIQSARLQANRGFMATGSASEHLLPDGSLPDDLHDLHDRHGLPPGGSTAAAITESERSGRAVRSGTRWVAAVRAGSERLGALILTGRPDLNSADQRILERGAMVTALRLLTERSVREAEYRVRGELVTDLLDAAERGDPDLASLRERARRVGADLDARHVLVVAQAQQSGEDRGERRRLAAAAAHLAATHRGLAGERAGLTVLILPGEDPAAIGREAVQHLRGAVQRPVTGGAAGPVGSPAGFAAAEQEAARCLAALTALGRFGDAACGRDLGFVGLLLGGGVAQAQVPEYIRSALGPVLDYDARRSTELVRTLDAYFSCGGNLMRTKDELHVHVNTVTQRLDRIAHLLGADWNSPERALELQLALRLHRLR
jgi:sugar diacid utilization regulator